jgi:acetolactate synthase I/II/III large subunit
MRGTVGDLIVETLRREQVSHVFGLIGTPLLALMDALARAPEVRYVSTANEHGAALMAEGYGRVTRRPGVCIATVGGAATNLTTGLAQGRSESSPMVAIVDEVPTRFWGMGYSNRHNADQTSLFRAIVKRSFRLERGDRAADTLRAAFRIAQTGRPGPVYVGVPKDVLTQEVEWEPWEVSGYRPLLRPSADEGMLRRALEMIMGAERPVILAGGGVRCAQAESQLIAFAERLGVPVVATQENKGVIPEDHPLSACNVGQYGRNPAALQAVRESDVILAIGSTFNEWTTAEYSYRIIPAAARIIQVDIDPEELGKQYPVELALVGDARVVLEQALRQLEGLADEADRSRARLASGWARELAETRTAWREEVRREAEADRPGISRLRLLHELRRALDRDAIVIGDGGGTHSWVIYGFEALGPVHTDGDYSTDGSGICIGIAAKLTSPERQVVVVPGDGSFMMTMGELWTAVRHEVPVLVVVPHNNAYGNIRQSQTNRYGRLLGTDITVPDLGALARALGAHGEQVEDPRELRAALARALGAGRPAVLDVMVDDAATEGWTPPRERHMLEHSQSLSGAGERR